MNVIAIPGLEHLPYAEVWLHEIDDEVWRAACARARELGKTGLDVWTTDRSPTVVEYLRRQGYQTDRRYAVAALDVASAGNPGAPGFPLVTLAERPDLAPQLYALARVAHGDQPGREGTVLDESWFEWGLAANPPEAYFVALDGGRVLAYGYLQDKDGEWWHGFTAVARDARGRGLAGAIKRAQVAWAKANGVDTLRTANEVRLEGMLDLNRRLGYRRLYEEIVMRGPLAV
jgi:GNAT superfamily N-acetyltransferase